MKELSKRKQKHICGHGQINRSGSYVWMFHFFF
uniref:Uncharacterized protein n=1 Tax=Anguilla anguilla TaxID=7936 RepID=A0A0E9TG77_ANGAN